MPTIGTTALEAFRANRPTDFVIHAATGNTDIIRISATDPKVSADYEELLAGQTITFEGFTGALFVLAVSGTQTYHIPFVSNGIAVKAI
jgi:hypothetical protein